MLAAPAAVVALLALRPVAAAVVLLVLQDLAANLAHKPLLLAQALLQVVAVLVPLLAVAAVPVELPRSRRSSSAAMARITTWPPPPYDPVLR